MPGKPPTWLDWLASNASPALVRYQGATEESLRGAESVLGFKLPVEYREFLKASNGAHNNTFQLYPISSARHIGVVELHSNTRDPVVWPLLGIGHINFGSDEEWGFLKRDIHNGLEPCPIYVFWHESGDWDQIAQSFRDLMYELCVLGPNDEFIPPWQRKQGMEKIATKTRWWQFWK